jgi:tripartite-type tricarboxylate transporter receptor subunit TctC
MVKLKKVLCALTVLGAASFGSIGIAAAEEPYPTRLIKMIVPNPAGGVGDLIGRVLAEKVSAELGQPIVIENKSGATTVIGTDAVARSKPDGYTILSLTASGVVVSVLREKLPYSLERDFTPIISVGSFPMALTVSAASKINSFADLVAAATSTKDITYASGGVGTLAHLSSVRLIKELNGTGNHVPYRGNKTRFRPCWETTCRCFSPRRPRRFHSPRQVRFECSE